MNRVKVRLYGCNKLDGVHAAVSALHSDAANDTEDVSSETNEWELESMEACRIN